jgi:hypothetical protein
MRQLSRDRCANPAARSGDECYAAGEGVTCQPTVRPR